MEATFSPGDRGRAFDPVQPVYLFHGEDDVQKEEALALLRAACIDEAFADFDYEALDASVARPDEILAVAGLAPFGSPRRLVVVKAAELYRRRERSGDAEVLATGIPSLGRASCLALIAAAGEADRGKAKTLVHARLDAAVRANGCAVQFKAPTGDAMIRLLGEDARTAGKTIEGDAARRLIEAVQGDRLLLQQEIEKAICYVGDRTVIRLADVEEVCVNDPQDVMFKLVDAVVQGNASRAIRLFRETLRYDTKPQGVVGRLLALLRYQYRLLWQAGELQHEGLRPESVRSLPAHLQADLPAEGGIGAMAWKARDLFTHARRLGRAQIAHALESILECDLANKGGGEGSEDVVTNTDKLLLVLCGVGQ